MPDVPPPQPAPPPRQRRGTAALVLAALSLVLSLISCGVLVVTADTDLLPVQSPPQPASASEVEAVAHVTLPPGTVLLSAVSSGGLESRLSAKFRMPRERLDAFLADSGFTAEPTPGLRAITKQHDVGLGTTWRPEEARTVSGIEDTVGSSETRRVVMFDLDDPDTVTVYLYAARP